MKSAPRLKFNIRSLLIIILTYIIAFIMIINCNSIFMASVNPAPINRTSLFAMVLSSIGLILLQKNNGQKIKRYVVISGILIIYILIYILIQRNQTVINTSVKELFKFILMFSLAYLVYRTSKIPSIFKAYCNEVSIIALISLIFWLLGSILHILSPTGTYISSWNQYSVFQAVPSYYNIYFETQILDGVTRNSAIFAEAPMASLAFSIALCLESLYLKKEKSHNVKIIILFLAILSTLSSTGYICLILIIVYRLVFTKTSNKYLTTLRLIAIPVILVVGILGIRHFLSQKLNTNSGSSRSQDYLNSFKAWAEYPFLGAGINMGSSLSVKDRWIIGKFGYSNSVGRILGENGLYIFSLYLISLGRSLYIGLKSQSKERIFLTLIFLYLFITTIFVNTYMCYFFFSLIAVWRPNYD